MLLLVVPLGGAGIAAIGKRIPRLPVGPVVGLLSVAACLALLVPLAPAVLEPGPPLRYELGGWAEPVGIALYLDGLAWSSSLVGLFVALCALAFAVGEGKHANGFYVAFLLLVFSMEGVILTGDLFNLFVSLEVLSIASYLLIAGDGEPRALLASFRYLALSSLGMAFFLVGVFLCYRATGTLSLRLLSEAAQAAAMMGRLDLGLGIACLAVGAGVKAAFLPFHLWLPPAHAVAPHAVSAVLSGVIIKVSFLVVWRLLRLFEAKELQTLLLWIGAATALFGVGAAIAQTDGKRLLSFSSVSQIGFIVAAFGAGSTAGLGASFSHLISHSLFKSLLFLAVGTVIHVTGEHDLRRLGGQARRLPGVFILFLAGALSIGGLPPFNGYVSKDLVTSSLQGWPLAYALLLLAGAGTVASFLKLSGIFLGRPGLEASPCARASRRVSFWMYLPMAMLGGLCLATGLFPRRLGGMLAVIALDLGASGIAALAFEPAVLYSPSNLAEAAATVATGVALYALTVRTDAGRRLLARLRRGWVGLDGALVLLVAGLLAFALVAWLG